MILSMGQCATRLRPCMPTFLVWSRVRGNRMACSPFCRIAGFLGFMTAVLGCGGSLAQSPLPPSVSVRPVANRQVTEIGDFIGRVVAINKVDIVARVPGFIE